MAKTPARKTSRSAGIFISHLTSENELASTLKALIEDHFVSLEVFVSSVPDDLPPGENWLDTIKENLSCCKAMLILCSPASIARPWINFEAGAGWVRRIPVIPICHSGMAPAQLPLPFSLLQGILADDEKSLRTLIKQLANIFNCRTPHIPLESFLTSVKRFETEYSGGSDLLKVYDSSRDAQADIGQRLQKTKSELWMCGAQFGISLSNWRKEFLDAAGRGVKIKLAVLDPDCIALTSTAESFSMSAGELRSECRDTIEKIAAIRAELARKQPAVAPDAILAVTYNTLPRARYYIFDPGEATGVAVFIPYLDSLRSSHSPAFAFRGNSGPAKTYAELCSNLFSTGTRL